jgi:hypothetical protein
MAIRPSITQELATVISGHVGNFKSPAVDVLTAPLALTAALPATHCNTAARGSLPSSKAGMLADHQGLPGIACRVISRSMNPPSLSYI